MKRIAMVSILVALGGCASQPAAPDWVSGAAGEYRAAEYLIGRGQGPTGEEARDRARADLAKIFEAEVTAASADEQSF
ncbi:MAG: lipoprotein, partial [Burkholderiales bacterium]|nr:lipoprotein [Burkholderiales bacterium]